MKFCSSYGYEYSPQFYHIYNISMKHTPGKYYRWRKELTKATSSARFPIKHTLCDTNLVLLELAKVIM